MALKIVYKICPVELIDVHKTFVVTCIASIDIIIVISYVRHRFSIYTKNRNICFNGFSLGIARMSAWNLSVNTGFLFTIFCKMINCS